MTYSRGPWTRTQGFYPLSNPGHRSCTSLHDPGTQWYLLVVGGGRLCLGIIFPSVISSRAYEPPRGWGGVRWRWLFLLLLTQGVAQHWVRCKQASSVCVATEWTCQPDLSKITMTFTGASLSGGTTVGYLLFSFPISIIFSMVLLTVENNYNKINIKKATGLCQGQNDCPSR